tara:strand:- start:1231 stop:2283 length:1053 start_codon:yes stop_codon:yes gene_type:complete
MSNFDRLNNYLASFDAENERITSSINNQMLEKIISENQVQFNKDQEEGGGLVQGGQMLMNGQEQVVKFQKGLNTIKNKLDKVRDNFNQAKEELDDLPNKLQNYKNQGNDLLETVKERKSQLKNLIENKVKNTQTSNTELGTVSTTSRFEDVENTPVEVKPFNRLEATTMEDDVPISVFSMKPRGRGVANEDIENIPEFGPEIEPTEPEIQPTNPQIESTNPEIESEKSTEGLDNELKTSLENQEKTVESKLPSGNIGIGKVGEKVGDDLTADAEATEMVLPELSEFVLPAVGLGLAVTGLTDLFSNSPEKVPDVKPPVLKPPPNFQKMIQSQTTYSASPQKSIQQSSASF